MIDPSDRASRDLVVSYFARDLVVSQIFVSGIR